MRNRITLFLLIFGIVLAITGCSKSTSMPPDAGLEVQSSDKLTSWHLPENLVEQGENNTYRALLGEKWNNTPMLELAAGSSGHMEYFAEIAAEPAAVANFNLQFLSTQGIGRIKISTLDKQGQVIETLGWAVTGELPQDSARAKWIDARSSANYQGDWMKATYPMAEVLAKYVDAKKTAAADKYRLSIEVGQGQHVLVKEFALGIDQARLVKITPVKQEFVAKVGDNNEIRAIVFNHNNVPVKNVEVKLVEPYGFGIVVPSGAAQIVEELKPGESRELVWKVRAQRADRVNLNQPWQLGFSVNGERADGRITVAVSDQRPGKIFYVMTEDLEPIDSAGYPAVWGNKNAWLDPEEYLVQMVNKAEQLNHLADRQGAKWTHYIAWPAVKAAEWAASQSTTGKWQKAISAIEQSVRSQSGNGHEYGIHLHSDYDPSLPGNVLSYNPAVDGVWANHLKHGWAHSTAVEGDFSDTASRVGLLYRYQQIMDELSSGSGQGQLLTARAGSFDFGSGSTSEAISTAAFYKTGLWGSSDADGNIGGITSADYGQEIYFAAPDDINSRAIDLSRLGIVEFRPTPRQFINYDSQTAAIMNGKADQGIAYYTREGKVSPGVHAIVGFTHAMFIMGDDGWQSTEGGQFTAISDHLAYLKTTYVNPGLLTFGTATELVSAYLDYYTPKLLAVYGERLAATAWSSEYAVRLLGEDIPIDASHQHLVSIKYPLYHRDSAYRAVVLKNDQTVYTTWGLPTPYNDIQFTVDDKEAKYTLKVYHNKIFFWLLDKVRYLRSKV
ncbi:hypothetical protein SDC9_22938 [bioreactor metagenome]|uniref:Uncharacterized protein n=1 Tax=bioreactor metagenome TaxID=1076179 RepID=A0A644UDS2_9ZZZZ|nr:hypothetical protein [Negativicutes bacterium]